MTVTTWSGWRADGHAHADFRGAARHRVRRHAEDADEREHQAQTAKQAEQHRPAPRRDTRSPNHLRRPNALDEDARANRLRGLTEPIADTGTRVEGSQTTASIA